MISHPISIVYQFYLRIRYKIDKNFTYGGGDW